MKRDSAANRITLAAEEDVNGPARLRINEYLAHTGLRSQDFAQRIGYSEAAMRLFLCGSYHVIAASARRLVTTSLAFIDQHPIGPVSCVNGELYETKNVRVIQETFEKLLPRPVAYMIYAPPGSQKSFVLEHQVAKLNQAEIANPEGHRAFYIYARARVRPRDLVRRVATACGCRSASELDIMLNDMRFTFRHQRVLLVVDEAQHLDIDCFETLRELLDRPPYFSLLFAGSHDLKRKFDQFSATLEQWNSRIIAKVRLPGLEHFEAVNIIKREIGQLLIEGRTPAQAQTTIEELIDASTVRDAFEGNRTYINVRTLTNALDQIKSAAAKREILPSVEEVA